MAWSGLSNGFCNLTGALFAAIAFSCFDGKFQLPAQYKPREGVVAVGPFGRMATAQSKAQVQDNPRIGRPADGLLKSIRRESASPGS